MKKLVIGCGLGLILFTVAASAAFYYFVYRPAKSFVGSLAEIGEIAELDAKVTNTKAFSPPADDVLTEAQVRRFVSVQEALHARMGNRGTELQAKYKALDARSTDGVALTDVVGVYKDLFGTIGEAKRAQVEALNAQGFSVEEYTWVKSRFYEAAGVSVTGIDFREMANAVKDGDMNAVKEMATRANEAAKAAGGAAARATTPGSADAGAAADTPAAPIGDTPGVGIPDANKTLVAPYKDKVATWLIYGAFGL
ncbi:hypothetical protein TBR22_A22490 [Luteitalea sp. TBR-22]|uniref:hypothetical protein n=1 Tax=Luteitalea sp. TBR-22 TaxID=2802971 RepID=UPI001AF3D6C2|nr:hypothetical protein [Luteitalea sp. TBR-22]BCS33024.1 hypothetical protein TBR22_A22490 [Luteitalea sp. TBR-22]